MEILRNTDHESLVLWYSLVLVPPLPGNFKGGFDCLCSSIHRQDHVEVEILCDELCESREDIVVEGSRAQSECGSLLGQCLDQLWMAMALIDSRVCGQEV